MEDTNSTELGLTEAIHEAANQIRDRDAKIKNLEKKIKMQENLIETQENLIKSMKNAKKDIDKLKCDLCAEFLKIENEMEAKDNEDFARFCRGTY